MNTYYASLSFMLHAMIKLSTYRKKITGFIKLDTKHFITVM